MPGLMAKFSQNSLLKEFLVSTGDILLAEASYDRIWGIGKSWEDKDIWNRDKWSGKSLLENVYKLDDSARQKSIEFKRNDSSPPLLDVFCYDGESNKRLGRMFSSATLQIRGDQYQIYRAHNSSAVIAQHESSRQSWFNFLPWQTDSVNMDIFNRTCVGVETDKGFSIQLHIRAVDPKILMFLVVGLILFLSANKLSKNVVFYYGAGVSVGVVASLLILVFIFSKFLPKKHYGAYAILVGGWSIALYIFQKIWENAQLYIEQYFWYMVGYLLVAGFASFSICYYKGPPSDPRSLDLVQWAIQALALLLMYFGTSIPTVSLTIIGLTLICYNFPYSIGTAAIHYWRRRFPPKLRFLTEEEYVKQGSEETQRALDELREYCQSPDCNAWKTISRLQSPQKFAEWVGGSTFDVSEDEIECYEMFDHKHMPSFLETDDDDDDNEIDFRLGSQ